MQLPSVGLFIGAIMLVFLFSVWFFARSTMPRRQFILLPNAKVATSQQRVLILVPHPDDESLAVGGYINMCCQNGANVRLILVSDGNYRGFRALRYQEFKAATRELGIPESNLRFWGYPDGSLMLHHEAIDAQLQLEIEQYRPDFVIYPHPHDKHKDHSILGRCAERSLGHGAGSGVLAYAYLIHYKFFQLPAFFSHLLLPPRFTTNHEEWHKNVLSLKAYQAKCSALKKYRSQLRNPFLIPLFRVSLRDNELLCMRMLAPHSSS